MPCTTGRCILFLIFGVTNLNHALVPLRTRSFRNSRSSRWRTRTSSSTSSQQTINNKDVTTVHRSSARSVNDDDDDDEKKRQQQQQQLARKGRETLTFAGHLTFVCDSILNARTPELVSFLTEEEECRRLLLGAGGTRAIMSLPASAELQHMWEKQMSGAAGGLTVDTEDSIPLRGRVDVDFFRTETVVQFPGLTLTNTVVNGFTIVEQKDDFPQCVSVLIGESRTASGRTPLVWIFNKLTGDDNGQQQHQKYSPPKARVVTYSSVIDTEDGTPTFQIEVHFEVLIGFSKTLLRFLPTSKEKMEATGSAAIEKALSKDFEQAIQGVRAGFIEWHTNSSSRPVKNQSIQRKDKTTTFV